MSVRRPEDIGMKECTYCGCLVEIDLVDEFGRGPCCQDPIETVEDLDADVDD